MRPVFYLLGGLFLNDWVMVFDWPYDFACLFYSPTEEKDNFVLTGTIFRTFFFLLGFYFSKKIFEKIDSLLLKSWIDRFLKISLGILLLALCVIAKMLLKHTS
jgi:hypothetical protein